MDQNFSKTSSKRVSIRTVVAIVLFVMTAGMSQAADNGKLNESEATISSAAVINGEMIFTLKYDNSSEQMLEITITDAEGNRLYRKISNDKSLNTTFKIPSDLGTIYLTVYNKADKTQKKFLVSPQERMVEKVVIGSVR